MKIWLVVMENRSEPDRKVYIVGAHSRKEAALAQQHEIGDTAAAQLTHVLAVEVDREQAPVFVGVAATDLPHDCRKNTPNG